MSAELAARLVVLREWFGLTQAEVAEKVGMPLETYADCEQTGSRMWKGRGSVELLLAICDATGVSSDWLLSGTGCYYGAPPSPTPVFRAELRLVTGAQPRRNAPRNCP
ncbi:MAG: helix-turn-helix transcriptional regulator [Acetobacteraceae bacterium]|nr:helix-turn-helix transcriptional regulator [Acetobacteraceae bacterium]